MARMSANGHYTYSDEEPEERSDDEIESSDDGMASDDVLEGPLVGPNHVYEPVEDQFHGIPHGEDVAIDNDGAIAVEEPDFGEDGYEADDDESEGDADEEDMVDGDADDEDMVDGDADEEEEIGDGEVIDPLPPNPEDHYFDYHRFPPAIPDPYAVPHAYPAPHWVTRLNGWSNRMGLRPPYVEGPQAFVVPDGTLADRSLPVMVERLVQHDIGIRNVGERLEETNEEVQVARAEGHHRDEQQGHHRAMITTLQHDQAEMARRILLLERELAEQRAANAGGNETASSSRQARNGRE